MQKFIEIAHALQSKELSNYNGFMAIMTGLGMSFLSRLKRTFALLQTRRPETFAMLQELTTLAEIGNGMYNNLLARVSSFPVPSPCVPFLGSFLTALDRSKAASAAVNKSANITAGARLQGKQGLRSRCGVGVCHA
jgi:hypothetical protein